MFTEYLDGTYFGYHKIIKTRPHVCQLSVSFSDLPGSHKDTTMQKISLLLLFLSLGASRIASSVVEKEDRVTKVEKGDYEEQGNVDDRRKRLVRNSCGPDVTDWLVAQMNSNMNHAEIKHCRSWYNTALWPRCLVKFAQLVGNCRPWDFKCTQSFNTGSCHSGCPRTVTLCGRCVNYDVPGNIHYGWVGRAASIRRWFLLYAADRVQKGGVDDPKDQNAINIGMDLWDSPSLRSRFCHTVLGRISSLNLQGTSGCRTCNEKYT